MNTPTDIKNQIEKYTRKNQEVKLEEYNGVLIKNILSPEDLLNATKIKLEEDCECCRDSILSNLYQVSEYKVNFAIFKLCGGIYAEDLMWGTEYREANLVEILVFILLHGKSFSRIEVQGSRFRRHDSTYVPLISENRMIASGFSYRFHMTSLFFVKRID